MPTARNDAELRLMLKDPLQDVVDYVIQKIWNENKEVIRVVVYEAYRPMVYNRTNEFRDAWEFTQGKRANSSADASAKLYYKYNNMSVGSLDPQDSSYGQHISIADGKMARKGESSRKYLADILYQGIGGDGWGGENPTKKQRNAYKELVRRIGKRKLLSWFDAGFAQVGLKVKRHNAAVKLVED